MLKNMVSVKCRVLWREQKKVGALGEQKRDRDESKVVERTVRGVWEGEKERDSS